MSAKFVKPKQAEAIFGVHRRTLKKWADEGHIKSLQPGGVGQILFDVSTVTGTDGVTSVHKAAVSEGPVEQAERVDAVYARVSTRKQAPDLERQLATLRVAHPDATVFSDIASGLNFKRKGLRGLLKLAFDGRLRRVHVAHRDRLCRFAFDLVEHVLNEHGATIVVDSTSPQVSDEQELAEDVLSIVTVFGARLHGKRSGQGRKRRREEEGEEEEAPKPTRGDVGGASSSGDDASSSSDEATRPVV